ncbi:hypothetical protein Tco_0947816 [Tanacetum coccineum]
MEIPYSYHFAMLSAKTTAWNEFSSTMASAIIFLATNQKFNFSKYIFESMVKNLDNSVKFLMYPRRPKRKDTELPQPSGPTTNVANEAVYKERDDSLERTATTAISLDAEQDREPEVNVKDVNLNVDEVTLAQELTALKSAKVQEKSNVVEDPSETITITPTLTTTTAATTIIAVKAQDKCKGLMVEEPMKMKKKDQISLDGELTFKLQDEEEEEERIAREKAQREEEANIVSWDNLQAMIDADYQMAQQMQAEEQEELSIEEKSKLFVQLLEARKKHFAAMRAREMMNKPPTKAQKRNIMSTYLKNMAGY